LWFFYPVLFLFVWYIIVGFLFLFLLLFSFCTINFTITIFSSLFSPLSLSSFSCATIHYFPSQLLFLPLLFHSLPLPSPLFHPPSTCHYTTLHFYTLITCRQIYCTNFIKPQPLAIPDTNTLHYSNRNTLKHTQGPQNSAAPSALPPLTHHTSHLPI
jgi:hypothetical protein